MWVFFSDQKSGVSQRASKKSKRTLLGGPAVVGVDAMLFGTIFCLDCFDNVLMLFFLRHSCDVLFGICAIFISCTTLHLQIMICLMCTSTVA